MKTNDKRTILSIDDEEIYRELINISLEFHGLKVVQAKDGAAGLNLARSAKPDLILLDLVMPEMSGLEVCRRIFADPQLRTIPLVVLSGSDDSSEIEACLQLGAVDYLLKPFEPGVLIKVVLKHLATSRAGQAP
jgi:CheY-like chemotaxis protein